LDISHWKAVLFVFLEWQGAPAIAILVSAAIATLALLSFRDVTKRKNSIDLLFGLQHDDKFIKGVDEIRTIHYEDNHKIEDYAELSMRNDERAKQIRYVLNLFEHMSIGILRRIYDEPIIKETIKEMIVYSYEWSKPYIERRRTIVHKESYVRLEKLVNRWTAPLWKKIVFLYWVRVF